MIRRIVDFALSQRWLVLALAFMVATWGVISFHQLPVEAYPDIADNYVTVITQWPGRAAEEVEQQVTIPVETVMNGLPHLTYLRSESIFGLSFVIMIFDDTSNNDLNRQKVLERINQADLPDGVSPSMGTDWSTTGEIYWYTLKSTNPKYDIMEVKSLQDWVLTKQFKSVPGVADVSTFGGPTREYQVRINPDKLVSYGLSISDVENQLSNNNINAGGSFVELGMQQMNVRALGLYQNTADIEQTVLQTKNGTPLRVKDIADVTQGAKIRLGHIAKAYRAANGHIVDDPDAIYGIVYLLKGADADPTLEGIHAKVKELNERILPPGVKVLPMFDRADLLHYTLDTVLHNLVEGMLLVVVILFLFLLNARAALIVALTIPFSLLFASIWLDVSKIPANLLSLGALDFGMVVDGAVVMIENIVRHMTHRREGRSVAETIRDAAHEVQRPVFYAIAIIITAYMPIFTLQRVEGRLFRPMAWTVAFALLGAMSFSILIAPVLSSFLFRKGAKEIKNPVMTFLTDRYRNALRWAIEHRLATFGVGLVGLGVALYLSTSVIGSEFLPHLEEGSIQARGSLAVSTSLSEAEAFMNKSRLIFASFPEVVDVVSQAGRPDDGTDTGGFGNTEYFINLKPKEEWRPVFHQDKTQLIAAMNRELVKMPGAFWNFSQPIEDNVGETLTGTKGELAVKLLGTDLRTLDAKGQEIEDVMSHVPGITDLGVFRLIGQPNLNFTVDRQAAARYQVNVADIQDAIETAVGGKAVSTVLQGEERYDVVARYQEPYRNTREAISKIRLLSPSGERVSLGQLTKVDIKDGAYDIYREGNTRYVAIRFNVRGRDLGDTVGQAIRDIDQKVKLPQGYRLAWSGEYESKQRADARLMYVVPLTIAVIFLILYSMFQSAKWALVIMATVVVAPVGGVLALLATGTFFSVASGVGFLALFGVSVQTGVIMLEYINQLRARGRTIKDAAIEGAVLRLRPIMMTMLVATFGLLPAAFSHAIGSDSQRPFAIVIVGGLVVGLAMSIFILPTLYVWVATDQDVLPVPEMEEIHGGD